MAIGNLIANILNLNAAEKRSNENFQNQYFLQQEADRMEQEKEKRQRGYKKEDVEIDKKTKQFESDLAVKQAREQARNSYFLSKGIDPTYLKEAEALSDAAEQTLRAQFAQSKQEAETGTEASRQKIVQLKATEKDYLRGLVSDAATGADESEFKRKQLNDPSFQDARIASFRSSYLKPVFDLGKSATQAVGPGEYVRRPSIDPYIDKLVPPMSGQGMTQGETTKMVNIGGMTFPQTQRTVTPGSINYGSPEFSIKELPSFLQGTNLEENLLKSLVTKDALTQQLLRPRTPEEEALLKKRKQEEAAQKGSIRSMIGR